MADYTLIADSNAVRPLAIPKFNRRIISAAGSYSLTGINATLTESGGEDPTAEAGWTEIYNETFDVDIEDDINYTGPIEVFFGGSSVTHITDDTGEPISPNTALQGLYPIGLPGGSSEIGIGSGAFTASAEAMVEFSMKFSSNYKPHSGGTNKLEFFYISPNGGDTQANLYLCAWGDGVDNVNNPLLIGYGCQGVVGIDGNPFESFNLTPNIDTDDRVTLGDWHHFCAQIKMNSNSTYDGVLKLWRKSGGVWTKIMEYTTIQFHPTLPRVEETIWTPMRGGGGDNNTVESNIRLGNWRLWRK